MKARAVESAPRRKPPTDLQALAQRLYPNNEYLQQEWRRAVCVVRRTADGWLLDKPVRHG